MAAAVVAIADDKSSSNATPGQSSSSIQSDGSQAGSSSSSPTNSSNLPKSDLSTTEQQNKAPAVDPQAATTASPATSTTTASGSSSASAGQPNSSPSGAPQTGSAPQRYDANRISGTEIGNGRGGGASLGVNIVTSENSQGVMVARTQPGTPADKMGLQPRDRILTLNGQPVGSADQFIAAIRGMNPGDQIELSINRGGNAQNLGGRLEALRDRLAAREGPVGNMIGRARDFARERGDMDNRGNRQTSYEEGIGARPSSDLEARLSRLEQQMERLTREIEQLRASPSSLQPPSSTPSPPSSTTQPATR